MAQYKINPVNNQEVLEQLSAAAWTHYCWITQLTISGPQALAAGTPGTYTVTAKDYQGNALANFTDTVAVQAIDSTGKIQPITVTLSGGTGTFRFSSATAGTFTLVGTGETTANIPYDSLPAGGFKVVVS